MSASLLALSLCSCGSGEQAPIDPTAIADLSFEDQADSAFSATVSFVSDDVIAIYRHPYRHPTRPVSLGTLTSIRWDGTRLTISKSRSMGTYLALDGLFSAGSGNLIASIEKPPRLLSSDLSPLADIPTRFLIPPVPGGTLVGDLLRSDGWMVYRLTPVTAPVRRGPGQLLSFSDDLLVIRSNDEIHVEGMAGQWLGSFTVPRCRPAMREHYCLALTASTFMAAVRGASRTSQARP